MDRVKGDKRVEIRNGLKKVVGGEEELFLNRKKNGKYTIIKIVIITKAKDLSSVF